MELYDDQDEFFNLVQMTSEYKGIPEKAVEKASCILLNVGGS